MTNQFAKGRLSAIAEIQSWLSAEIKRSDNARALLLAEVKTHANKMMSEMKDYVSECETEGCENKANVYNDRGDAVCDECL